MFSATKTSELLKSGRITSVQLVSTYVARIKQYDSQLNAVVVRDFDRAFEQAQRSDERRASNLELSPLDGLPITVKESLDVEGLPTTWGNLAAKANVPAVDAEVVRRLKELGCVVLGKTNVPLNVSDFQTYNEVYGTTNNPWDTSRTPGGSSGGSAVAVAAGLTGMGFGTDLGGSVRTPAHFCGVYAHKPTWGLIPFRSQTSPGATNVAQELDMAVVGPVARSAEDLALAVTCLAGADKFESPAWQLSMPGPNATSLKSMRVALWPECDLAPVDQEISERIRSLEGLLKAAGAKVSITQRPAIDLELHRETYRNLVMAITADPSTAISYPEWLTWHARRGQIRQQWVEFFTDWDVLIAPVSSTMAFPHDQSEDLMARTLEVNGSKRSYWEHIFWASLATLSYLPATTFPSGVSASGLPMGLQVIGAEYGDFTTIEFARLITQQMGGYVPPPNFGVET